MANLTPVDSFDNVYQLEITDPVLGGAGGIANQQAQDLANRTKYLYERLFESNQRRSSPLRNTILRGAINGTTGLESLLTYSSATVTLNATSTPMVACFSDGITEFVATLSSDLVFTDSGTHTRLVFVDFIPAPNSAGSDTFTLGIVDEADVSINSIAPVVVTGGYYYNLNTGLWYKEELGAWVATYSILVGTYTINSNITSMTTYPYRSEIFQEGASGAIVAAGGLQIALSNVYWGGYLLCDGSEVSRTKYARLFQRIGTTFGSASGTTFTLPDLRGMFVRGFDGGRGLDASRVFGSDQEETKINSIVGTTSGALRVVVSNEDSTASSSTTGQLETGSSGTETTVAYGVRPMNVALYYLIKI